MFFEREGISFNILDVVELAQRNVNIQNKGRNFNALSLRLSSDAIIRTKNEEIRMSDNTVSYVPARLAYSREATKDEMIVVHFETSSYHTKNIEFFQSEESGSHNKAFPGDT